MSITLQPGKESFHFPAALIPAERSSVLSFATIFTIGGNQFNSMLLRHFLVKSIAVISLVPN